MRVLYVHQNFPAQFGHIASHLALHHNWECTFISEKPAGMAGGVEKIQYQITSGATERNHFCSRTFENNIWHCDAIYTALLKKENYRPDLIVGHSGFGSTLFLRELYPDVPCINLFEYYYRPHGEESDMDFRQDLGWKLDAQKYHRARCRNAMILLDLQNCDAAYAPTEFQRSRFPGEYLPKIEVIFDGIDRNLYHGFGQTLRPHVNDRTSRTVGGVSISAEARVVTYVSRGFESMRGFDIFMQVVARIARENSDVVFMIVGSDRIAYGGDSSYIGEGKTFKQWVLERGNFDLSRFHFLGQIPPGDLARLLASSDLHIYLTVPFVLSWSMLNAMSCGAVVLGSATGPVKEMIRDGENGLLADFFDVEEFASKALKVLADPDAYRSLGQAAENMIEQKYSMAAIMPRMIDLYRTTAQRGVTGQK